MCLSGSGCMTFDGCVCSLSLLDVCRAIVHSMDGDKIPRNSIFNVCDNNDTDQGKINVLLRAIFKIKTSFYGRIISNIASLRLADVVDTANEKHLKPWNDLCMRCVFVHYEVDLCFVLFSLFFTNIIYSY